MNSYSNTKLKYLNLVPCSNPNPHSYSNNISAHIKEKRTKKRKTTQHDLAKPNTWGIIMPLQMQEQQSNEYNIICHNNINWTLCRLYENYFWKNNDNHMIFLDTGVFDVNSVYLSDCGKYFIIIEYGGVVRVFDIFKQLMFTCKHSYLRELTSHSQFHSQSYFHSKDKNYYYVFIKFSDDFSKAYLNKHTKIKKRVCCVESYVLCLASNNLYKHEWKQ